MARAAALVMLVVLAAMPVDAHSVSLQVEVGVTPHFFRVNESLSANLTLTSDVPLGPGTVLKVELPFGAVPSAAPTPPTGWMLTAWQPQARPPWAELTSTAAAANPTVFGFPLGTISCAAGYHAHIWRVTLRTPLARTPPAIEKTQTCDKVPPILISVAGHVNASTAEDQRTLVVRFHDTSGDMDQALALTSPNGTTESIMSTSGEYVVRLGPRSVGSWRYHATAIDAAGNVRRVPGDGDFLLNVTDATLPDVTLVAPASIEAGSPFDVDFNFSDNADAIASAILALEVQGKQALLVDVLGETNRTFVAPEDWQLAAVLRLVVTDAAGNANETARMLSFQDTRPPLGTIAPGSTPGWASDPFEVILNATDAGSPRLSGSYTVNFTPPDGSSTSRNATGPLPLAMRLDATGTYGFRFVARDDLGNEDFARTGTYRLDLDSPTASVENVSDAWVPAPWPVTFIPHAPPSGIAAASWRVDDITVDGTTKVFETGGIYDIAWSVTSGSGIEGTGDVRLRIDDSPPNLEIAMEGERGGSAFHGPVNLTARAEDSLSAPVVVHFRLDGEEAGEGGPILVTTEGPHEVNVTAQNAAGLTTRRVERFMIDLASPLVSVSLEARPEGEWNSIHPRAVITASDAASGIDTLTRVFDVNGAAQGLPVSFAGGDAISFDHEGAAVGLRVVATDHSGRTTSRLVGPLKVDTVSPTTDHSIEGTGDGADYAAPVILRFTGADATSGLREIRVSVDGQVVHLVDGAVTLHALGVHTVTYHGVDVAGNFEGSHTFDIHVDELALTADLPPFVHELAEVSGSATLGGRPGTVHATFVHESGVSRDAAAAVIDGAWQMSLDPALLEGRHTVTLRLTDEAGRSATELHLQTVVDRTSPRTLMGAAVPTTWARGPVTLPITCLDDRSIQAASGCEGILVDGAAWDGTPLVFSTSKIHQLALQSRDRAGNLEPLQTVVVRVDAIVPEIKIDTIGPFTSDAQRFTGSFLVGPSGAVVSGKLDGMDLDIKTSGGRWEAEAPFMAIEGAHEISLVIRNGIGEERSTNVSFSLSRSPSPPVLAIGIEGPASGTVGESLTFRGVGEGITSWNWAFGDRASATGPTVTHAYAAPGHYVVTFLAASGDGRSNAVALEIEIAAPVPERLPEPLVVRALWGDAGWVECANVRWMASGLAGEVRADATALTEDGRRLTVGGHSEAWSTQLSSGPHRLRFEVSDTSGNVGVWEGVVNCDADRPQLAVAWEGGVTGRWTARALGIAVDASDAHSGIAHVRARLDAGVWQRPEDLLVATDGRHIVEVEATDVAGNVATQALIITLDTLAPAVEAPSLVDRTFLVEVSDAGGLASLVAKDESGLVLATGTGTAPGRALIVLPLDYPAGGPVRIVAKDHAGNVGVATVRIRPDVSISSPPAVKNESTFSIRSLVVTSGIGDAPEVAVSGLATGILGGSVFARSPDGTMHPLGKIVVSGGALRGVGQSPPPGHYEVVLELTTDDGSTIQHAAGDIDIRAKTNGQAAAKQVPFVEGAVVGLLMAGVALARRRLTV